MIALKHQMSDLGGISWLRKTAADGYIPTDFVLDSRDVGVEVWAASGSIPKGVPDRLCLYSVSSSPFSSPSQIGSGNAHGWSVNLTPHINGSADRDQNVVSFCGNGSGDVYAWGRQGDGCVRTADGEPPVFNRIRRVFTDGWLSGFSVNGSSAALNGAGSVNWTYPAQAVVLFAHHNPDGGLLLESYKDGSIPPAWVHSVKFFSASTGETLRLFKAAKRGNAVGMLDEVTHTFFPATGSFGFGVSGMFAPQLGGGYKWIDYLQSCAYLPLSRSWKEAA